MIIATIYGPIIAGTYLTLRLLGAPRPDQLFAQACLVGAVALFITSPRTSAKAFLNKDILVRSIAFAISQHLLVYSFAHAEVSSGLMSALVGTVFAYSMHGILTHGIQSNLIIAAVAVGVGIFLAGPQLTESPLALIAGLLSGISFFLLKKISNSRVGARAAQVPMLLITAAVGLTTGLGVSTPNPPLGSIALSAVLIVMSQHLAYLLNRQFSGTTAVLISGARIPSSLLLEAIFVSKSIKPQFLASTVLILAGLTVVSFLNKRRAAGESLA